MMTITATDILELCASVADSHGTAGKAIAVAIRAIDLNDILPIDGLPLDGVYTKYIYRQKGKGFEYKYFRTPSGRLTRLPNDEKSSEFRRQYRLCWREMKHAK
jgi:hypothetical protein